MKYTVIACSIILLLISVFLPVGSSVLAFEQQRGIDSEKMLLAANTGGDARIFDRVRYNPSAVYSGAFKSTMLYYQNPGDTKWRLGLNKELSQITCREASNSLKSSGTWEGHINLDGVCEPTAEPVKWAVGNLLNFKNEKR